MIEDERGDEYRRVLRSAEGAITRTPDGIVRLPMAEALNVVRAFGDLLEGREHQRRDGVWLGVRETAWAKRSVLTAALAEDRPPESAVWELLMREAAEEALGLLVDGPAKFVRVVRHQEQDDFYREMTVEVQIFDLVTRPELILVSHQGAPERKERKL